MDKKNFGAKLRTVRKDCSLTSERLAEICNINATYLRQIESGAKIPSLPVFVTLCNALRVSPAFLLSDSLEQEHSFDLEEWTNIQQTASPKQLRIISAMIHAACECVQDDNT